MNKESEKNTMGWLKGVLSNQNQPKETSEVQDAPYTEEEEAEVEEVEFANETVSDSMEEPTSDKEPDEELEELSSKPLFSKNNQDKVSLDLIVSLENMLKDRELLIYKNKGLKDQLGTANETINRYKHDEMKKDQLLHSKNKEIRELEINLTNKQMSYDQLLEDYKEFQSTSNSEYSKISNELEKQISKYNKLSEESTNAQYESMLKIKKLEEQVRSLEIENQEYMERYEKNLEEKEELMQTINDFTERMSFSFSQKKPFNTSKSED